MISLEADNFALIRPSSRPPLMSVIIAANKRMRSAAYLVGVQGGYPRRHLWRGLWDSIEHVTSCATDAERCDEGHLEVGVVSH